MLFFQSDMYWWAFFINKCELEPKGVSTGKIIALFVKVREMANLNSKLKKLRIQAN